MSNEQKTAGSKVIAKQEEAPCGCVAVFFTDGTGDHQPCVPCALVQAGQLLSAAGLRLGREIQQAKNQELMRRKMHAVRPQG